MYIYIYRFNCLHLKMKQALAHSFLIFIVEISCLYALIINEKLHRKLVSMSRLYKVIKKSHRAMTRAR